MTCNDYSIRPIASRIDDIDANGLVFSRPCRGYLVVTPSGNKLLVLVDHFKSEGNGCGGDSGGRRTRWARRVRRIREATLRERDAPDPLLRGSALLDAMLHPGILRAATSATILPGPVHEMRSTATFTTIL